MADGGLLPRLLDLGLAGLDLGRGFFLFLKIDFGCRSTTTDNKKRLFFVSGKWYRLSCIGEMVSAVLTHTYNLLPNDMKNYFCSSGRSK
jgi:hypothetical protein